MKKIKIEGKLNIQKETISQLNREQMENINGGADDNWTKTNLFCGSSNAPSISCLCPLTLAKHCR